MNDHAKYVVKVLSATGIIKELAKKGETNEEAKKLANFDLFNTIHNLWIDIFLKKENLGNVMSDTITSFKTEFEKKVKPTLIKLGIKEKHQDLVKSEQDLLKLLTPYVVQVFEGMSEFKDPTVRNIKKMVLKTLVFILKEFQAFLNCLEANLKA